MTEQKKTPGQADPKAAAGADEQGGPKGLLADVAMPDPPSRMGARLRNYFLAGLIIVGPVGITIYILWWFVNLIDGWVKPLVPVQYLPETYLPFTVPGVGLIFAIIALMMVGALAANLFGRTVFSWGEMMLDRMPVVRGIYKALKQIFETVLSQSNNSFKTVGLIEFPRKGLYSICFISTESTGEIRDKAAAGGRLLSVFLPTTPNPTTGYLMFVAPEDVIELEMTIEEAAKMLISAGLIEPERQSKLAALARRARGKAGPPPPAAPRSTVPETVEGS